ncbi:hypothetical protein Q0812_09465 [Brevundimonas sp. 2R-24]|uniref:Uncharacterized protein n=1 Tax=Peiella sedimenti TaxID=3061083 RepID=A0ABT8SNX7_9CAUL|nr:hypothetical protein [Caulobacteraceae bacterium XZ-24]
MFETLYSQLGAIAVVLVCGYALWKGGDPEKAAAAGYFLIWIASMVLSSYSGWSNHLYPVFALDVVVFVLLVGLSLRYRIAWPMWAAAFQLIGLLAYVSVFIGMTPSVFNYRTALAVASYGVLGALAVGAFLANAERDASKAQFRL